MRSTDLDMALSRNDAQGRLRAEIDQLSAEITLVLRNILIERTGQPRIVPSGGLGVVIDKIDTSCVCKTHFPSRRKWPKLGYRLLLNSAVVCILSAVHADVLLAAGVYPGGCARVVIHKVRSPFRSVSLFPARRQFSGSGGCGSGSHHADSVRRGSARR